MTKPPPGLCIAVLEMTIGLFDADLGRGLFFTVSPAWEQGQTLCVPTWPKQ
jgi:hypothetical protein